MTNLENKIEAEVRKVYPDAIITCYFWSTGEMIFYPHPDADKEISCVYRNGKCEFIYDF